MINRIKILSSLFLIIFSVACKKQPTVSKEGVEKYSFAFYNLENLFDTVDDPAIDDQEFLPTSDLKWDETRYQAKLQNMAKVIENLGDNDGPELLGVCEIENKKVLEDLVSVERLKKRNYGIVHFDSPDPRGIDVALLYKKDVFKPIKFYNQKINFSDRNSRTRDVLYVKGLVGKDTILVLVNHWPSRRGGQSESEERRVSVARQVRQIVDKELSQNPDLNILIMGDFNDEPFDKSIKETLMANGTPDFSKKELFNAVYSLKEENRGSYSYRGGWDMIDQIIMSKGLMTSTTLSYIPKSANIYAPEFIKEQDGKFAGAPLRTYAGKKYLGGYSDHFPVYIHVSSKK